MPTVLSPPSRFFPGAFRSIGLRIIFLSMEKRCTGCGQSKQAVLANFAGDPRKADGLRAQCRRCQSDRQLARYHAQAADYRARAATYRDRVRSGHHTPEVRQGYRPGDREKAIETERRRRLGSMADRLARRVRKRLKRVLDDRVTMGGVRDWLGCSAPELVAHIESQFAPGMSWDNRGEWHVDHIRPLASFDLTDPAQRLEACHYTNLQPLWAADNIAKGARLDWAA